MTRTMKAQIEMLEARLEQYEIEMLEARLEQAEYRLATSEACSSDERHCSCVPWLRRALADERAKVAALEARLGHSAGHDTEGT